VPRRGGKAGKERVAHPKVLSKLFGRYRRRQGEQRERSADARLT
jgi:hypothetical protein